MFHRRLLQLLREVRGPVVVSAVTVLLVSLTYLGQAVLVVAALTALIDGRTTQTLLLLAAAVAVVLVRAGLVWLRSQVAAWCGGVVRIRLRDRLIQHLAELGPEFGARTRTGAVRGVLMEGVDGLDPYYSRYVPQVLVTMTLPPVLLGWLFTVHAPAAAVLTGCVLVVLVVPRFKDAALLRTGRERWQDYLDISADYLEALDGVVTLRSFGAAQRRRDGLQARSERLYRSTMAELRVSLAENGFSALVMVGGTAAAVATVTLSTWGQSPTPTAHGMAVVLVVLLLAVECFRPVRDLTAAWHAGYLGLTAVDGLELVLGAVPAVPDRGTQTATWSAGHPPTLVLSGVELRRPGADRAALVGVDLTIPAGATVAVVGPSGAGKTTLAKLVARSLDPTAGRITMGGVDLTDLQLSELRRTVAVVPQDSWLFSGTVRSNLTLGITEPTTDDALWSALDQASAADLVRDLPQGLDTEISEGGTSVSGGERQRLALARALVRDPAVLVLDEVTSHLDGDNETQVVRALRSAAGRRTCLVVAHRLSTVRHADLVIVLDRGRVVQHGRFDDLLAAPGPFRDLAAADRAAVSS